MRLNLNDPNDRKLLSRSESGRKTLQEYEKLLLTKSSPLKLIDESYIIPNINDSNQTNDTRCDLVNEKRSPLSQNSYNKYRNIKTIDPESGEVFDSNFELKCWQKLSQLQQWNVISNLKRGKEIYYKLEVNNQLICTIRPDFEFTFEEGIITADAKSSATQGPIITIKKKLFKALFKREIVFFTRENSIDGWIESRRGKT